MKYLFSTFEAPWMSQVFLVLFFFSFLALIVVVFRPSAKKRYDEHSQLPFKGEDE